MTVLILICAVWHLGTLVIGSSEIARTMKSDLIYHVHCRIDFKPADMWVGMYEDRDARTLYWCLLPMLPVVIWWSEHEVCAECGSPMHKIAFDTGDGWGLEWDCDSSPGMHEAKLIEWPTALENYATSKDLVRLGFEIV